MKILNLYAGIGGNRKLWGDEHDITAVEWDEETANVYQDYFPNDEVIVDDAHQYLLENYKEFDFVWSSPPCPTHSRARFWSSKGGVHDPVYPDMKLWQEIVFLDKYFDGKYIVENVTPYYRPFVEPTEKIGRHLFWSNFLIGRYNHDVAYKKDDMAALEKEYGFQVSGSKRRKMLRNCVHPQIGKHILDRAQDIVRKSDTEQTALELT